MNRLLAWYEENARDLPWRRPEVSPWAVLVSEVMSQQTPVARVAPVWTEWMQRWPTSADLAAEQSAVILGAWGRLGYPRRALRLHQAAQYLEVEYAGEVPRGTAELRAIPGVGEYTAAAVQAFAFGLPVVVLDVNVRRVLTRVMSGTDLATSSITNAERQEGARALEAVGRDPRWNVAIMEFGSLICTARNPACEACPIQDQCRWRAAGYPEPTKARRGQAWEGTDRQVRGKIMGLLRAAPNFAAPLAEIQGLWPDPKQLQKALETLGEDGLIHQVASGNFALGPALPTEI